MRPDSDLMFQIPRCAWMGGDPPKSYREISKQEKSLVRTAFREAMRESIEYWGDGAALCYADAYDDTCKPSTLINARIQWRRARYDAHASIQNAHARKLYKGHDNV